MAPSGNCASFGLTLHVLFHSLAGNTSGGSKPKGLRGCDLGERRPCGPDPDLSSPASALGATLKVNPEERLSITELVNQLQEIAAARNVNPKSPITEVGALPGVVLDGVFRTFPRGPPALGRRQGSWQQLLGAPRGGAHKLGVGLWQMVS